MKHLQGTTYQVTGESNTQRIVFFHGSGGGPDTPFMEFFTDQWHALGFEVVRPDFPYWQKVRATGVKRPPDRIERLVEQMRMWLSELQRDGKPLWLAGKSLGSRVMLRLADEFEAQGQIALGFPFNPPSKPERSRLDELGYARSPGLIIEGTRDPFAKQVRSSALGLPSHWQIQWLEGADHGFEPTAAKRHLRERLWLQASRLTEEFLK